MRYENILDSIGNTPLIRLNRLTEGMKCKVYVKAEFFNPGGSVKDRIATSMIDEAERKGWLKPGGTIIEGTTVILSPSRLSIGASNLTPSSRLLDPS